MKVIELKANLRQAGRKISKELRNSGFIPCVYYAMGKDNINFYAKLKDLRPFVYTAHKPIARITIQETNQTFDAVVKDMAFDPVTDNLLHLDFVGLIPNHPVTIEIPVILKGTAIGTRVGGKLNQVIHKVEITATPENLIDALEVDVTNLNVGQQIQFKDITKEGWKFSVPPSALICSIKASRETKTS